MLSVVTAPSTVSTRSGRTTSVWIRHRHHPRHRRHGHRAGHHPKSREVLLMELGEYDAPMPYAEWLRVHPHAKKCCTRHNMNTEKCDSRTCAHACADDGSWLWHGAIGDVPTPETIFIYREDSPIIYTSCSVCGRNWHKSEWGSNYFARVHAMMRGELLPAEFDEEAERARLVAVER